MARRHEEAVALHSTEAYVGAAFRQVDVPDRLAAWRENPHAVQLLGAAPSAPEVPGFVDAEAVGRAFAGIDQNARVREPVARAHFVGVKAARLGAALDDVEEPLVGREGEAVGTVYAGGGNGDRAVRAIDAIDVVRELDRRTLALVIGKDAEGRVREPDGAVGFHHHVVWRVEGFSVEAIAEHGDPPVVLGARDAPRAMLAGDEAALAIARVAVGEVGRRAKGRDLARLLVPAQDALVGNVAPEKNAQVAEPHGAFGPAASLGEALHVGATDAKPVEPRVERSDRGVGIT